jgi:outer membrane protein
MRLSNTVVTESLKKTMAAVSSIVLLFSTSFPAAAQEPAGNSPAQNQQKQPSNQTLVENPVPQKPLKAPEDFTKGKGYFPNPIGPYTPRTVAPTSFENTPRIDQLIKNETLYLSLNDAIALALENNLDIAVARYNLEIADTDILRARSGQGIRGVASGLVQGTPGGGQGGFGTGAPGAGPGGTSAAAGGAGTGTSGLVQSTTGVGPAIEQFDPSLTGTLSVEHASSPLSNTITTGVPIFQQNTTTGNFSYSQGFATGTDFSVGLNNNRQATNSRFNTLNPTLNSSFRFTARQHLLQGFGLENQLRFIHIAQKNRMITEAGFTNQVITTVSQIQNIYWDLVNAYEDLKVRQHSVALSETTLNNNKKQVEIGTLAPIEIVRANSDLATNQQQLIVSQTNLLLQQTLMKNAISRSLNDPRLAAIPVIPTDTMVLPGQEPVIPVQDLVQQALQKRPDLQQQRINLTINEINRKAAKNSLLPTIDVFAFYGASGLAGPQNPALTCGAAGTSASSCLAAGSVPATGFSDAFGNLFDSSAPDKGAGISINIPIRNRAAQADQVRSELEYRQQRLQLQQLLNTIAIQIRNAQFALQQNRALVDAAAKGRELAAQSLDAEQKRYSLGASTTFLVSQAQRDLVQAESNYVAASSNYEKSRVELDRVTGATLDRVGISLEDAVSGVVKAAPAVPGVAPRQDQQNGNQPAPSK